MIYNSLLVRFLNSINDLRILIIRALGIWVYSNCLRCFGNFNIWKFLLHRFLALVQLFLSLFSYSSRLLICIFECLISCLNFLVVRNDCLNFFFVLILMIHIIQGCLFNLFLLFILSCYNFSLCFMSRIGASCHPLIYSRILNNINSFCFSFSNRLSHLCIIYCN